MIASKNIDKDKSILGAPPKLAKKEIKNPRAKNLGLRKVMLKSPKRRSSISVIIVEQLDTLDLIATSGKPLNTATTWS